MKLDTKNKYFPFFLDISGKKFLIVGGGRVAERKVRTLLRFKANIQIVSPKLTKKIEALAQKGLIEVKKKEYDPQDLNHIDFVISATNDKDLNRKVSSDAKSLRILVNVVDAPEQCDFIVPSVVKRGPIVVAISTSGNFPLLSKKLRKDLEKIISLDYEKYVVKVGNLRREVIEKVEDKKTRRKILKLISDLEVKELATKDIQEIRRMILERKK
ncbi:MAG: bifunctional precorrin-2 dehydrogenase/sirohydrochlorin ferrochelatase [Deltaproteobacteria bacterium]|nr:bifunctional precorrin-2 dehydrogenase/sirohydrochlorin ferrochelatase [Deltaproteobacteria bacterium]